MGENLRDPGSFRTRNSLVGCLMSSKPACLARRQHPTVAVPGIDHGPLDARRKRRTKSTVRGHAGPRGAVGGERREGFAM